MRGGGFGRRDGRGDALAHLEGLHRLTTSSSSSDADFERVFASARGYTESSEPARSERQRREGYDPTAQSGCRPVNDVIARQELASVHLWLAKARAPLAALGLALCFPSRADGAADALTSDEGQRWLALLRASDAPSRWDECEVVRLDCVRWVLYASMRACRRRLRSRR